MPLLLSNGRLRRQVLMLALIIGTGLFPERTLASGVKCYSCDGSDCKTNQAALKEVECESGYCDKITEGDSVKMRCSPTAKEGECIKNQFPGGCYTSSEENKAKLTTCWGGGAESSTEMTAHKDGINVCSCNSNLCNGISEIKSNSQDNTNKEMGRSDERGFDNFIKCYECNDNRECHKGQFDQIRTKLYHVCITAIGAVATKRFGEGESFSDEKYIECYKNAFKDECMSHEAYLSIARGEFATCYRRKLILGRQMSENEPAGRQDDDQGIKKVCVCFTDKCNKHTAGGNKLAPVFILVATTTVIGAFTS